MVLVVVLQGGKLEYLIVTPAERKKDFTVMNCAQ